MKNIPIVLTGGHAATTALAVMEEIKRQGLPWSIHFIGVKSAVEGRKIFTLESQILKGENVFFHPIIAGRLQRRFGFWTIPSILKIPFSFFHALILLVKIKPKLILSFGGFAGFPVVVMGKILGIPSVLHEQTTAAGRANIASSYFANFITLARESSRKYFRKKNIQVVGNPVLSFFSEIKPKKKLGNPPVIYITAGSRGSVVINTLIEKILRGLLVDFRVIHQTGAIEEAKFRKMKDNLPTALSENYTVFGQVAPFELRTIYPEVDVVISRAGANSVAEIMLVKRPAILIPIPWSNLDEQNKNALFAKNFGIARVLDQETLTGDKLMREIKALTRDWPVMVGSVLKKETPDLEAAHNLVDVLKRTLKK